MASCIVNVDWLFYSAIAEYSYSQGYKSGINCTATNGTIYMYKLHIIGVPMIGSDVISAADMLILCRPVFSITY